MRIAPPERKSGRLAEPLLPMIDVVFFLIIFFMMVSRFAEPEPFALERPLAGAEEEVAGERSIYLSAEGVVAVRTSEGIIEGDAAVALLATRCVAACGPVLVHADAAAPAAALAALVPKLAAAGLGDVRLVTVRE